MSPSQPATPIEGRPDLTDAVVALTFDDGPDVWTEPILNTLRATGVRATFFVIGDAIPGMEKILARTAEEGHELGNHTLRHPRLDLIETREEIEREIVLTNIAIKDLIGTAPAVFRPPGFHHNPAVLEVVGACGFEWVVQASAWMDDYNRESPQEIVEAILSSVKPRSHHRSPRRETAPRGALRSWRHARRSVADRRRRGDDRRDAH